MKTTQEQARHVSPPPADTPAAEEHVRRLRVLINEALEGVVTEAEPTELYAPVRYVLEGRGKRLRPILLLLAAEAFGADAEEALPAALAVEVFHNFTLVHDDIMDHAHERRGRPTVHVRWDENTAILAGDLLMALSYDLLVRVRTAPPEELVRVFHAMVCRLCEGQALDKAFETRPDVSVEDYLAMVDRKTGALLATALELGARAGRRASEEQVATLRQAGQHVGRAFQIRDDLLDLVAEDERWGKTVGGDLIEGKKTYLLLRALERADGDGRRWFERIGPGGGLPPGEVPEARKRMRELGVLEDARAAVLRHSRAADTCLGELPDTSAAHTLRWLVGQMQARMH